jgi:tetratricopeptide (TPR) repeat protein
MFAERAQLALEEGRFADAQIFSIPFIPVSGIDGDIFLPRPFSDLVAEHLPDDPGMLDARERRAAAILAKRLKIGFGDADAAGVPTHAAAPVWSLVESADAREAEGELDGAVLLLHQARDRCLASDTAFIIPLIDRKILRVLLCLGERAPADEHAAKVLDFGNAHGGSVEAQAEAVRCEFLFNVGDLDNALSVGLRAQMLAHDCGDGESEAEATFVCAKIFFEQGRIEQAERLSRGALALFEARGERPEAALSLHAEIAAAAGRWRDAWAIFDELRSRPGFGDRYSGELGQARLLLDMPDDLVSSLPNLPGNLPETAAIRADNAVRLAANAKVMTHLPAALYTRAMAAGRQGQHGNAAADLELAIEIDRRLGDFSGALDCLIARAQVAYDAGQPGKALEWIQHADELYRSGKFNNPLRLVKILEVRGGLLQERGDSAGALAAWIDALAASEGLTPAGLRSARQLELYACLGALAHVIGRAPLEAAWRDRFAQPLPALFDEMEQEI